MKETYYNKRTWLNPDDSPSCGFVICYDGVYHPDREEPHRNQFVAVGDCYQTARIHRTDDDSQEDWYRKCRDLRDALDDYLKYLERILS